MGRLSIFLLMVVIACLLAAVYGALHNQVSYTVGPDYFHHLKFAQFGIADTVSPRLGAAQVGVAASWWMGLVIGLPLALLALLIRGPERAMIRAFLVAVVLVIGTTAGFGMMSLGLPLSPEMADRVPVPAAAADPEGFRRAALLHGASYLAAVIGMAAGLLVMGVAVIRSRRG